MEKLSWPPDMGAPLKLERLSGLGANQVFKASFRRGSAALKLAKSPQERDFYQDIAPRLRQQGLETPALLWSTCHEGIHLIALEWLDQMLPKSRWRKDDEVLGYLAHLHSSGLNHPSLAVSSWSSHINSQAARVLPRSEEVLCRLEWARVHSGPVLAGSHIVSGDPNGGNWAIKKSYGRESKLVLFDWERVGLGTAALDLAGVVFGEPEDAVFEAVAAGYLKKVAQPKVSPAERSEGPFTIDGLVRDMKIARVFIAAVLLSRHYRYLEDPSSAEAVGAGALPESVLEYYRSHFCTWLATTVKTYS